MKKEIVVILLLLVVSFPAVKALLQSGGYTSHDLTHHVIRQISMDRLLSEGQFPPRWSGELNNGYGYPLFLFNYPLPALFGEVFYKLGFNFVYSVKAVLFSSMILSVLGMYLFLKSLTGSKLAAFTGSIFYLYAPIRFINIYVSASLGASLALAIVPFIFLSILMVSKKQNNYFVLLGAIFLGLLILSHNVTALIFSPVILTFAAILIWQSKEKVEQAKKISLMFLLGLGLSAWFWMPAFYEKDLTKFNDIFYKFYQNHFPSLVQMIRSPWGHGLSDPQNYNPGGMSYQIGLIHIGAVLIFSFYFMVKGRKDQDRFLGLFALVTFFTSVFLMLKSSLVIWKILPFLSLVQFPWRLLALPIFAASILAALLIKKLPFKKMLAFGLILLVIYANRNHWRINEVFDPGEKYYLSLTDTGTSYGEHLPQWGRVTKESAQAKLEFIKGGNSIRLIENKSAVVLAKAEATDTAKLRFNQFYFPGWEIKVDGKRVDLNYLVEGESYGLPTFDIDAGSHQILAEFKNTKVRNIADTISLVSVILWGVLLCKLSIRK